MAFTTPLEPPALFQQRSQSTRRHRSRSISDFDITSDIFHYEAPFSFQPRKKRRTEDSGRTQTCIEQLKLSLAYCDGGVYDEVLYPLRNALVNDASVYCTEEQSCCMILRHESGGSFTLERLEIQAPNYGYTSPIAEGVVIVSDEASYGNVLENIRKHKRVTPLAEALTETFNFNDFLNAAPDEEDSTPPIIEDARGSETPSSQHTIEESADDTDDDKDEDEDREDDTSSHGGSDTEYEGLPAWSSRSDCPNDIVGDNVEQHLEPEDDEELLRQELMYIDGRDRIRRHRMRRLLRRAANRESPAEEQPKNGYDGLCNPTEEFVRFTIEDHKAYVVFNPPRYCRNIVLKLWGMRIDNVDIQAVLGYGYYGKRQFPVIEFR